MIGNVIQARFLQVTDYPTASALSFILMAAILVGVFIYARVLGTEELTGGVDLMAQPSPATPRRRDGPAVGTALRARWSTAGCCRSTSLGVTATWSCRCW